MLALLCLCLTFFARCSIGNCIFFFLYFGRKHVLKLDIGPLRLLVKSESVGTSVRTLHPGLLLTEILGTAALFIGIKVPILIFFTDRHTIIVLHVGEDELLFFLGLLDIPSLLDSFVVLLRRVATNSRITIGFTLGSCFLLLLSGHLGPTRFSKKLIFATGFLFVPLLIFILALRVRCLASLFGQFGDCFARLILCSGLDLLCLDDSLGWLAFDLIVLFALLTRLRLFRRVLFFLGVLQR